VVRRLAVNLFHAREAFNARIAQACARSRA